MSSDSEKLLNALYKVMRVVREQMYVDNKTSELTILQLQTLVFLKKNNGAQMSEIATHFRIELPSATSLVNKLVRAGLVKRKRVTQDRRVVHIELSTTGGELLAKGVQEKTAKLKTLLAYLPKSDQRDLLRIVEKLAQNLETSYEKEKTNQ